MIRKEDLEDLSNWTEVTSGYYCFTVNSRYHYEISIMDCDTRCGNLLIEDNSDAELYIAGMWRVFPSGERCTWFERQKVYKGDVSMCLLKAYEDYIRNISWEKKHGIN